ncbi:hypothetical protein [Bradyrhizobium sp. CCBAU 51753]|uniref:hypothetical protein n=1 Tax=Bradyrhizobium sp. CCBAU 51753 TaxID=1325100 RepID=UPI00188D7EBE|nr:hypothetical protein [Bradyrhizobium sp. CCBAU 51753]QOZ24103.1 hypothetical protein XH93_11350 [Bradyrhizobium sp. CCBAU 51753]
MTEFDDERWYWAAGGTKPSRNGETEITDAADRFVIARGQRELWARVRAEVSATEHCAWNGFGPKDGNASLADFLFVMVEGREMYGANFNKVVTALAHAPAFAKAIVASGVDLCNWVSNPTLYTPLPRPKYDPRAEERLRSVLEATLDQTVEQ